jgi:hypothetical protein
MFASSNQRPEHETECVYTLHMAFRGTIHALAERRLSFKAEVLLRFHV